MLFITDALDGVTVIIWCNPAITRACVTAHLARRFIYSFVALLFFSLLFHLFFLCFVFLLAAICSCGSRALQTQQGKRVVYVLYHVGLLMMIALSFLSLSLSLASMGGVIIRTYAFLFAPRPTVVSIPSAVAVKLDFFASCSTFVMLFPYI